MKSTMMLALLAAVTATTVGCYTEHERHHTRVYEPAGADRHYYYDRGHRYERDHYYHDDRPGFELRVNP